MAIAQQVTQFTVIALMCIVPHLLAHDVDLRNDNSKYIVRIIYYLFARQTTKCSRVAN